MVDGDVMNSGTQAKEIFFFFSELPESGYAS